jgi:hypothetical protein
MIADGGESGCFWRCLPEVGRVAASFSKDWKTQSLWMAKPSSIRVIREIRGEDLLQVAWLEFPAETR